MIGKIKLKLILATIILYHLMVFPIIGGCLCENHVRLKTSGDIERLSIQPVMEKDEKEAAQSPDEVFLAARGEKYTLTLTAPETGGRSSVKLATCGRWLFYKIKEGDAFPQYYQLGDDLVITAYKSPPAEPPGENPDPGDPNPGTPSCQCQGCTMDESCRCCCYVPGDPPTLVTIDYNIAYEAWTEGEISIQYSGNPNFTEEYDNIVNNLAPGSYRGVTEGDVVIVHYRDFSSIRIVLWDQKDKGNPPVDDDTKFMRWTSDTRPVEITNPATSDKLCHCSSSSGPSNPGNPGSPSNPNEGVTVVELIAWPPRDAEGLDMGCSQAQGPSANSSSGSNPEVSLSIEFGLGRDTEGAGSALFSFNGLLDESDPLKPANFHLAQPFHEPGAGPIQIFDSPGQGGIKLSGDKITVRETRTSDSVILTFHDKTLPSNSSLIATQKLKVLPAIGIEDPGIEHTEVRNGLTIVRKYYGRIHPDGARSWKEIDENGRISSGMESPVQAGIRYDQKTSYERVNNADVLVSDVTNKYVKYPWGERLVESTQSLGGEETLVTQYSYEESIAGKPGKLKWRINPDGSWVKCVYHETTGELKHTLRPWLSTVTHPDQATESNSRVETVTGGSSDQWVLEKVQGKLVSQTRTLQTVASLDPLLENTLKSWRVSTWKLTFPAFEDKLEGDLLKELYFDTLPYAVVSGGKWSYLAPDYAFTPVLKEVLEKSVRYDASLQGWLTEGLSPPSSPVYIADASDTEKYPVLTITFLPSEQVFIPDRDSNGDLILDEEGAPLGHYVNPRLEYFDNYSLDYGPSIEPEDAAEEVATYFRQLGTGLTVEHTPGQNAVVLTGTDMNPPFDGLTGNFGNSIKMELQEGVYAPQSFTPLTYGIWEQVPRPSLNPMEDQLPVNLVAFSGLFDITKTQTFTSDYSAWTGSMTMRDASQLEGLHGTVRRSVDSSGRVSLYSHDKGAYNEQTKQFDWQAEGEAQKVTTRTYAANPETLELIKEDPVYHVTMSDYQGLTRIEQTWHGQSLFKEIVHDYDPQTRERLSSKENGKEIFKAVRDEVARTYTTTDASGTVTVQKFTVNGETEETRKVGHGGQPDVISTSSSGSLTSTYTTAAGDLVRQSSSTSDIAGRTISQTDENGLVTTYQYQLGGRRTIETQPSGGTRITESYLDGQLKSVTGTAVIPEFHTYEVDADGNKIHTHYVNDDGTSETRSPRWSRSVSNGIGWTLREESPAPGGAGVLVTSYHYNDKGQVVRAETTGQKDQLRSYDEFGNLYAQGLDLNGNGSLDYDFSEPVTTTESTTVKMSGKWWQQTTTVQLASATGEPMRSAVTRQLLSGVTYSATVSHQSDGLTTANVVVQNAAAKTVTSTLTTNRSNLAAVQTTVNGLLLSQRSLGATGSTVYAYDALERPTAVTDAFGVTRRQVYDDATEMTRSRLLRTEIKPTGGTAFSVVESYQYHPAAVAGAGQVSMVTDAKAATRTFTYDLAGRQTFVAGSAANPIRYEYSAYGDLWKMHTYRTGTPSAETVGDVTIWERDPATGSLLSKQDALLNNTAHHYNPTTGRLESRQWARQSGGNRVTATYGYDDAGRLAGISYNDGTPSVTHTYHPDGRLKTTTDAAGLRTYHYDGPNGEASGESIVGGLLDGASLTYGYNNKKQRSRVTWSYADQNRSTLYTYDPADRLNTVTAFGRSAVYDYWPTHGQIKSLQYSGGAVKGNWTYDNQGRLESTFWDKGLVTVSRHEYTYDAMNRREKATRENGEQWRYDYNARGEVISGVKAKDAATNAALRTGMQFGYEYDLIGNRLEESVHTPAGLAVQDWTANAGNQITQREIASSRWLLGRVHPEADLTVAGGGAAQREDWEFAVPVESTPAGAATWKQVTVAATREGAGENGTDLTGNLVGNQWFAANPESLTYDEDGNLSSDGRWSYQWDGENRLKVMQTQPGAKTAGVPARRLEFAYDAQGRRIRKLVQSFELAEGPYTTIKDHRYIYDGWNMVAEFEVQGSPELTGAYAWGSDISGTITGAGGVGGLVLAQKTKTGWTYAPCYDGNGNVSAYVSAASGAVRAKFDYDPYGRPIWNELAGGEELPAYRFSTKYEDVETGLLYYGYRYYSPEMGRWISRDPIGEKGGVSLYGMVGNDAVNDVDILGLDGLSNMLNNFGLQELARSHLKNMEAKFQAGDAKGLKGLIHQLMGAGAVAANRPYSLEFHHFFLSYSGGPIGPRTGDIKFLKNSTKYFDDKNVKKFLEQEISNKIRDNAGGEDTISLNDLKFAFDQSPADHDMMTTINRSIIYAKMNVCYIDKSAKGVVWIDDRYDFDKPVTDLGHGLTYPSGKYYNFLIQQNEAKPFQSRGIAIFDFARSSAGNVFNLQDSNGSPREGYPRAGIPYENQGP